MKSLESWIESLALTHSPNFDECVSFLGNYFPLLHQFAETEQDKIWHKVPVSSVDHHQGDGCEDQKEL